MRKVIQLLGDSWPVLLLIGVVGLIVCIILILSGVINSPQMSAFFYKPVTQMTCGEVVLILFIFGFLFSPKS